jgi:hypothetical protein
MRYKVQQAKKPGRSWEVIDTKTGKVVEGGFFAAKPARLLCDEMNGDEGPRELKQLLRF